MLENIILGFLMNSDKSGYLLKQNMNQSTSYFFDASFGSIYPALKRLEAKGMIQYREIVEGNKFKKMYSITKVGNDFFMKWISEPIVFIPTKQDHLVKVFFFNYLPKEIAIFNLKDLLKQLEPLQRHINDYKEKIINNYDVNQKAFRFSTVLYGVDYYQFIINWCNNLIKKIEE